MASTTAQVSLNGAATGVGATVDFATAKSIVTCVIIPSKSGLTGVVAVEASQDGAAWVPMGSVSVDRSQPRAMDFKGGAFRYWRASVYADVAGSGAVTATFMEAG
jgi:hypothetical protein